MYFQLVLQQRHKAQGMKVLRNKFKNTAQFQASEIKPIGLATKRNEPGGIVYQEIANAIENCELGEDIHMDDDEAIATGMERVSRDGDLSRMHSGKNKKTHRMKKTWDSIITRRTLLTRVAKQVSLSRSYKC